MRCRMWAPPAAFALAVAMLPAAARSAESPPAAVATYEMEVLGVQADPQSGTTMLLLRTKQGKRELNMFIGPVEANAIAIPLQGLRPPRPLTHDLLIEVIHRLKATVKRVVITQMRENTYYASLVLEAQGQELVLDSRPSDAIALALREDVPILAAEPAFVRPPRPEPPTEERKP
jgi:bifunctional DNase/RNase